MGDMGGQDLELAVAIHRVRLRATGGSALRASRLVLALGAGLALALALGSLLPPHGVARACRALLPAAVLAACLGLLGARLWYRSRVWLLDRRLADRALAVRPWPAGAARPARRRPRRRPLSSRVR